MTINVLKNSIMLIRNNWMSRLDPFNEQKNNRSKSHCNSWWKYECQSSFNDEEPADVP